MYGSSIAEALKKFPFPYAGSVAVNIGDFMFLVGGNAVPAGSLTDLSDLGVNQAAYAPLFLGTAAEQKGLTAAAGTVLVDFDSRSPRPCTSTTFVVGDMVGFAASTGTVPSPTNLVKVTDPNLAIGRVAVGGTSLTLVDVVFSARTRLALPGLKVIGGQHTTAAASDTVATGLTKVLSVVVSLESDPGDDPITVSGQIGDQAGSPVAGSILIKTWKDTGGTDPTPQAASTFTKKVNWIAYGY